MMIFNRFIYCWLFCLILAIGIPTLADAPKVTFSCWIPAHAPHFIKLEQIYRESFAEIGYEFVMVHRPNMRAIQDANHGISDGECARDTFYLDSAPESPLLRVDVVVASAELQLWSNNSGIKVHNLTELNSGSFRIGYMLGSSVTKTLLTAERIKESQALVSSEVGLKMLSAGRIDVLIVSDASIKRAAIELPLPNPIYLAGTLYRQSTYAHLHPRHRKILPALTEQLKQRIPEGGIILE